ncbi:MlaE family ABC transporter permease [Cardinium endosymbiont of Culicoides punctatus]|uniref:MlaE family ABC transporter permease n=1 Tax=Cardinium endosymbiont of Culicoides punctatus TaxID=2304601 RepID=UPI00105847D3|nr:ABC transporter permease [Cardinium endosymbiont of Culicoides punctatus]TDG94367.1 putative phospholipid ABC transporter permease protein MlaE [Cardinium endosymbiont of Culicoides punctatus]
MIKELGEYLLFLRAMFGNVVPLRMFWSQVVKECLQVGIDSLFIICIISIFIGGATCIQLASQLKSPFISKSFIGVAVRNMTISELAPTVIGIVFTGKIGSSMASELGSMRISEQIDALEIMGVNTHNYLVLPKIIATVCMYPLLVIIAMFLSIYGGFLACKYLTHLPPQAYIDGLRNTFDPFSVDIALYKSVVYGFIVSSIACYKGFTTRGGALDVGKSSTNAVTSSCIAILVADLFLVYVLLGHHI